MDEPFTLEALEAYGVRQALVEGALAGRPAEPRLLAAGGLPHGAAGRELLADEAAAVQGLLQRLGAWRELPPQTVELELQVGTSMLRGALTGVRGGALREFSVSGEATAPALLAFWIRHLAACAGGVAQQPSELLDLDDTWRLPVLPHELAARRLQELLQLREEGLRAPLPLFPRAALAWARKLHAGKDEETADAAAQNAFTGGPWSRGDLADPHVARIYPDAEAALGEQFRQLAGRVCAPLVEALAEGGS
jgi:exodeoxyribonuclease V gamma subunit